MASTTNPVQAAAKELLGNLGGDKEKGGCCILEWSGDSDRMAAAVMTLFGIASGISQPTDIVALQGLYRSWLGTVR